MARVIPFIFGLTFLLGSCTGYRQTETVSATLQVKDSVTTCKLPDAQFNTARVTIANASNATQSFYLTRGSYDFRRIATLLRSIAKDTSNEEELAIALWKFVKDNTSHSLPYANAHSPHDPIRLINSFGSGLCDDRNTALTVLYQYAGWVDIFYYARVFELGGHMVAEVEYDNAWHMFDADLGVYYLDDKGQVASVDYISKHPEIVKTDFGKGFFRNMLTTFTTPYIRSVYTSRENNKVNAWHDAFPFEYSEVTNERGGPGNRDQLTSLAPSDEVTFEANRLNQTDKVMRAVFQHSLTDYVGKGTLKRNITLPATAEYEYEEILNYAITNVRLRAADNKANTRVYFSPDGVIWFYKGTLTGNNEIEFAPFSREDEPCTFNYLLKFVPENGRLSGVIKAENSFLFSPLLFTNPEKTFKIVAADSMARNDLSVKMEYSK